MTTLAQAPLIEAIFEIKWGDIKTDDKNNQELSFSQEDTSFFAGQFNAAANKTGFSFVENVNNLSTGFPALIPHFISHRFRKAENTWPCLQIGLGIFTTNQVNEGYEWKSFKQSIQSGLEILDQGHPKGLAGIKAVEIELKYIDGFVFKEGESASDFLQNKLNVSFRVPSDFLKSSNIDAESFQASTFNFVMKTTSPIGHMIIGFNRRLINGQEGYVMETTVRTTGEALPAFTIDSMVEWLEQAHKNQKHAFETLINTTFAKTFQ